MNWFIKGWCIVLFISACWLPGLRAQQFFFSEGYTHERLSFISIKNMLIVPVFINGQGPFNFILDTGVAPIIIVDSGILDSVSRRALRHISINGHGEGQELEAYVASPIKASIGHAQIEKASAIVLKNDVFNLSAYLGLPIHGIIGYHFFNSFTVQINYVQQRLLFWQAGWRKSISGKKIPIEILDGKPYVQAILDVDSLGKIPAKLIIDCGASHALSLEAWQGHAFPLPYRHFQANLGVGLSGKINGYIGRIKTLTLGDFILENVLTSFPDYNDVGAKTQQKQRTGNLGANILQKFNVIFDYPQRSIYLKKNTHFYEPFEHDMSGMELYSGNPEFARIFVSRVEPGSPADKAGIESDDEILSVNLIPTGQYTLEDLSNLLKSKKGRVILIEFARRGHRYMKLLALSPRI